MNKHQTRIINRPNYEMSNVKCCTTRTLGFGLLCILYLITRVKKICEIIFGYKHTILDKIDYSKYVT